MRITMSDLSTTFEPIIGMEIHIELATASKMFCGCKNDPFHAPVPNIYTCPVCLGLPGAMPVANKKAVEWTMRAGLALGCAITRYSKFDRKHYAYPDLPKGYQISQYDLPLCVHGKVDTSFGPVALRRIHLEEDTGKLIHEQGSGNTLVDFNRSGVPLVEIVTEPCVVSAAQAVAYAKQIRALFRYLGISLCDMEQGGMRVEVNISLRPKGDTTLPRYKVEVKNINSFRYAEKAIACEIARQSALLTRGEIPVQETRGWDESQNATFAQRAKEDAEDYRFFPEPDLPPLRITEEWLSAIEKQMPELPDAVIARWKKDFDVPPEMSRTCISTQPAVQWYDRLFREALRQRLSVVKLVHMIMNGKIEAQPLMEEPHHVVQRFLGATTIDVLRDDELVDIIRAILAEHADVAAAFRSGKENALHFLVGRVMKRAGKRLDAGKVHAMLIQELR